MQIGVFFGKYPDSFLEGRRKTRSRKGCQPLHRNVRYSKQCI